MLEEFLVLVLIGSRILFKNATKSNKFVVTDEMVFVQEKLVINELIANQVQKFFVTHLRAEIVFMTTIKNFVLSQETFF